MTTDELHQATLSASTQAGAAINMSYKERFPRGCFMYGLMIQHNGEGRAHSQAKVQRDAEAKT